MINDLDNRSEKMSSNDYLNECTRITAERDMQLNELLREHTREMLAFSPASQGR